MTVLQVDEMAKSKFDNRDEWLFSGVTAEVRPEDRIVLLGGSGQGKSTLLRILSLLEPFDNGALRLDGQTTTECKPQSWRKKVTYVAQKPVMRSGTVAYNLRTVSELHNKPFEEELARRYMEAVGLGQMDWDKQALDLSGGEQQRLALVRSLLLHPELLLLDEITSSLDPASKRSVEKLLMGWVSRRADGLERAYLWITHDLDQARLISNQVWFMAEGSLLERSATEMFFGNPATEQARLFIRSMQGAKGEEP
ncbi:ABC transporter ATP-binding protein [Paenibacillus sp. JDR-2]|uniref:ABC transporter ATP-binding protein n=1 Tax=Paenibacillus sp. (strain JDR-2) TaxID=324057 RepID=UPI000166A7DC|nr:ATP-binding cassette domain-containing protein [Paenibacillus sp. JDR-2]ACT00038.1 ABC transporter related [Paenibacillus sp. JDR-2]